MVICEITDGTTLLTKSSDIMSIANEIVKREKCTLDQALDLLRIAELDLISNKISSIN